MNIKVAAFTVSEKSRNTRTNGIKRLGPVLVHSIRAKLFFPQYV